MNADERKTILVTGGSRGIGAAVARRLAVEGHRVAINYFQSGEAAHQLVKEINLDGGVAWAMQADVSSEEEMAQLFSTAAGQFSPIQAVVHCAAPHPVPTAFNELSWDAVQEHIDIQVKGAFNCVKLALPVMVEQKAGNIVFIGSIFTDSVPPTQQAHYIMAKAALTSMARSLAVEYGPKGIRVNIISPGMTQTEMIADLPDKVKMLTKMQTPLRQLAEPSDIAASAAFLLSKDARHINGETIRVCGGIVMV